MRYFLRRLIPEFDRVLLIESGSRQLFEDLLRSFYAEYPQMQADLVTCYAGVPRNFDPARGSVYRVTEHRDPPSRKRLFATLAANRYSVMIMICSAEPIMTKWKWMMALRLRAKLLIVNENGDYFWFDRGNLPMIRHFVLFRAGLSGAGAVDTLARLAAFPFAFVYLVLFAATVHLRRKLRTL